MGVSGIDKGTAIALPVLGVAGRTRASVAVHAAGNGLDLGGIMKAEEQRGVGRVHQIRLVGENDRHFDVVADIGQGDRRLAEERLDTGEAGARGRAPISQASGSDGGRIRVERLDRQLLIRGLVERRRGGRRRIGIDRAAITEGVIKHRCLCANGDGGGDAQGQQKG